MDNKLSQIRRKIRMLRADMLTLEGAIRIQVNRDEDCSEASFRLMAMRPQLLDLIRQRNALGGSEECVSISERLKENHRPSVRPKRLARGTISGRVR